MEEIGQDLPSDGVRDEMEVEWVTSDTQREQTFPSLLILTSSPKQNYSDIIYSLTHCFYALYVKKKNRIF